MKEYAAKLTGQLAELTAMVRSDLSGEVRKKVNQLIIIDVHARDIIDTFVRDSIMDAREFAWESQLRFYWDKGLVRPPLPQPRVLGACVSVHVSKCMSASVIHLTG
jgi:hypothetical protein